MTAAPAPFDPSTLRISTDEVPEAQRVALWRELYGRKMLRLEIEPLSETPFHSDVTVRMLPGLGIVSGRHSPFRVGRTPELLTDGDDSLILQVADCRGVASQLGHEVTVEPNEAVLLSSADAGTFAFPAAGRVTALRLPRAALVPLLRDGEDAFVRPVPNHAEALRLLVRYLGILPKDPALASHDVQRLAVSHLYELAAVALGATRDAAEICEANGMRAARLRAIKGDIAEYLSRANLSLEEIARRQRVTPRYVQILFESEGTTFSQFVLGERLVRAYRMLTNPRLADRSIISVAFDAGFGDLSYFNRTFRRRYGAPPSEVRIAALRAVPA